MSKKRQGRNSKKFKKAIASKRARAPLRTGGRTRTVAPRKSAEQKAKENIFVGRPADPNAKAPKKPTLPSSKAKYLKNQTPIKNQGPRSMPVKPLPEIKGGPVGQTTR